MTSTFPPFPAHLSNRILCCYINTTTQIQKAKILMVPNWSFERMIFPRQRFLFEAIPNALLEIHGGAIAGEILLNKIPCLNLQVSERSRAAVGLSLLNGNFQTDSME